MNFTHLEKLLTLNFWRDPRNAPSPETMATIQECSRKFIDLITNET